MAKIGTAHVEIKPVLNEPELDAIAETVADKIAAAVTDGVRRGFALAKDDVALTD